SHLVRRDVAQEQPEVPPVPQPIRTHTSVGAWYADAQIGLKRRCDDDWREYTGLGIAYRRASVGQDRLLDLLHLGLDRREECDRYVRVERVDVCAAVPVVVVRLNEPRRGTVQERSEPSAALSAATLSESPRYTPGRYWKPCLRHGPVSANPK